MERNTRRSIQGVVVSDKMDKTITVLVNTTKKHYAAISEDIRREAANKVKLR